MRKLIMILPTVVLALGAAVTVAAPAGALVTRTGSGAAWKVQSTPTLPNGAGGALLALACPAAGNCWAVGDQGELRSGASVHALAEHWNGTAWKLQSIPSPSAQTVLEDVACVSGTACEAVGLYTSAGVTKALAERWNGTAWTVQATPSVTGGAELFGVSCLTAANCVAVGGAAPDSQDSPTLAEHWNGKTWAVQPMPSLGRAESLLSAVTCVSATFCLAVGSTGPTSTSSDYPLAESWNGKTWAVQKVANPGTKDTTFLNGVSCPAVSVCTAVGEVAISGNHNRALAERWNGKTWTIQNTIVQGAAPALDSVVCPSAANCTAVGEQDKGNGLAPLAEHWTGTAWTVQATPGLSGSESALIGVSCTTARCLAVGYTGGTTPDKTLAETN